MSTAGASSPRPPPQGSPTGPQGQPIRLPPNFRPPPGMTLQQLPPGVRPPPQLLAQMQQAQQQQQQFAPGPPPPAVSPSEADFEVQPVQVNASSTHLAQTLYGATQEVIDSVAALNHLAKTLKKFPEYAVPPPPNIMKPTRSAQFNKAKDEGNAKFRDGKLQDAVRFFTLALELAADRPPWEASALARDEMAVALSNRSAAYFNLGDWINSLSDADAVVKLKRPWTKGHFRKGKALAALGRTQDARDAIALGLEFDPANAELLKELEDLDEALRKEKEE